MPGEDREQATGDERGVHPVQTGPRRRRLIPRLQGLAIVLLLVFPLLARFLDLEADPPLNVAFIHAFSTDEGYYTFHARSMALFGRPAPPAFWDNQRVSSLFDALVEASFSLLGVRLWSLRLPQALLGLATVGLLYGLLRQEAGRKAALWGALFLAWSHLFIVYNRVGMYQTLFTFLCTASAWAWLRAWRRPALFLLSGALAALTLLTSLWGFLFLAGLAVASLLVILSRRRGRSGSSSRREEEKGIRWTSLLLWLGGMSLVLGPFLSFFAWPQRHLILRDLARSGAVPIYSNLAQVVANLLLFLHTPFFLLNLLPLLGILLFTGRVLWRWRRGRRPNAVAALLLGWFWAAVPLLAVVNYRPTRYFLYLLVPLCAALALVVAHWEEYLRLPPRLSLWPAVPLVVALALVARDRLGSRRFHGDAVWWAGVVLSAAAAFLAAFRVGAVRPGRMAARAGTIVAVVCLVTNAAFGLSAWLPRTHTVAQVSQELGQLLPDDALLLRGCTLTFENRLHCLPMIEPEEVDPAALSGYRLFYFTQAPEEGLPGDRFWGSWQVLDEVARLYEVAPGRRSLQGLVMGHF